MATVFLRHSSLSQSPGEVVSLSSISPYIKKFGRAKLQLAYPISAITSISTFTSRGRRATSTAERAGNSSLKAVW